MIGFVCVQTHVDQVHVVSIRIFCRTIRSNVFMAIEVKATGLKSLGTLGLLDLGIGVMREDFHIEGIEQSRRDQENRTE